MIEALKQKYRIQDWASITTNLDGLFSASSYDPYNEAEDSKASMGGNSEILITLVESGIVEIYILKFRTVMDMVKFRRDYSVRA